MNILWINNIPIPQIAEAMGEKSVPVGGWMVKLADEIACIPNIHLSIAFPYHTQRNGKTGVFSFYSFIIDEKKVIKGDISTSEARVRDIIERVQPDVIHIFGTEMAHSYVISEVCRKIGISDRLVISIQGMVSVYWKHYNAFLSKEVIEGKTFRDIFKGNIARRNKRMMRVGELEIQTIKNVQHVIGRTDWDRACTYWINPNAMYLFNNEMLRESFYSSDKWNVNRCERHSLFMSQATSPIKGLHLALEALTLLKRIYPDVVLYVAGKSYSEKSEFKLSYYEKYILKYIQKNGLSDSVKFTGFLNEREIVGKFLKSHIFISASSIENSPNSVCEAMYLGVPVVSSMVGGVSNLMEDGKEGLNYQADAPYMMAYCIKKIFDNDTLASEFSINAIKRATERHEPVRIVNDLIGIYRKIAD